MPLRCKQKYSNALCLRLIKLPQGKCIPLSRCFDGGHSGSASAVTNHLSLCLLVSYKNNRVP
jgi:hypothetical protein